MWNDVVHVTVIVLGIIGLYVVLSSKNSDSLAQTGFTGATNFAKTLQGR